MTDRTAKEVVAELYRRQQAGDPTALDELVAEDLVNHAAGPQGREGLKRILRTIDDDSGRSRSRNITWSETETSSRSTSRCTARTAHPPCRCSLR